MDNPTTPTDALWLLILAYADALAVHAQNPSHVSARAYAQLAETNLRDALAALASTPAVTAEPADNEFLLKRVAAVFTFLDGSGTLDDVDFGEKNPRARGMFWWRTPLRALGKDLRAALASPVHQPCAAPPVISEELMASALEYAGCISKNPRGMYVQDLQENVEMGSFIKDAASHINERLRWITPSADGVAGDSKPDSGHTT